MVNFPLSDTLFNDLAHFFTVCMFRSKPQRKKENPKGSAKKTRKLKNLFVLCPVNKLFRSYPILSLQQQTIQKVSMLFFLFFFLFNYRFKLYKLPTNPFFSAECNFIGFFFLFLATCYLNFPFFFQFIQWSFLWLLYWLDFIFVWQIFVRFALFLFAFMFFQLLLSVDLLMISLKMKLWFHWNYLLHFFNRNK